MPNRIYDHFPLEMICQCCMCENGRGWRGFNQKHSTWLDRYFTMTRMSLIRSQHIYNDQTSALAPKTSNRTKISTFYHLRLSPTSVISAEKSPQNWRDWKWLKRRKVVYACACVCVTSKMVAVLRFKVFFVACIMRYIVRMPDDLLPWVLMTLIFEYHFSQKIILIIIRTRVTL